jgi:serine/threonine protein kinase
MPPADPSLSLAQRIDAACDRFEADWKAGRRPAVEDYLSDVPASDQKAVRSALLAVQQELETQSRSVDSSVVPDSDRTGAYRPQQTQPTRIGRFEILTLLGEGAFGRVYKARDPQLDREVAIKVPKIEAFAGKFDLQRFLREAKSAAAIQHPNICPVHEVNIEDGQPYIVMAYVPGKSLADSLKARRQPLPPRQAVLIVRKLALALEAAHEKGIVHRDLKPANILFDPQRKDVVITDFGLAVRTTGDARQTQSGMLMGTPAYMSPEQARGDVKQMGPTSDIFALGVILYELLTGTRPFQGSLGEVIGQIQHVEPPSIRTHNPQLDERLDAICRQALAKKPTDRFVSMKALATALEAFLKDQPAATTTATQKTKEADPDHSVGMAQVLAALSADRRAETEAAVEAAVRRSRPPMKLWLILGVILLGGFTALAGIIFYTRTPTATVMIHIDVDLNDKTLSFFLDGKQVPAESLQAPIELKVGTHELVVKRGDEVIRKFTFTVSRDAGPRIELREETPPKKEPPPSDPKTPDDLDRKFAEWLYSLTPLPEPQPAMTVATADGEKRRVTNVKQLPANKFQVIHIDIWGNKNVTDANVDPILHWLERSKVDEISFHGNPIGDATVEKLVKIQTLKSIWLGGTKITDRSLELLATRPDLRLTGFDGTRITDAGVAHLARMTNLESLGFYNTPLTDEGLKHLAGLKKLRILGLGVTKISPLGLRQLNGLPIEKLNISSCHPIASDLKVLNGFPRLSSLDASGLKLIDRDADLLAELQTLETLSLNHNRLTDEGLQKLAALRNLKELAITDNPVTDEGVARFKKVRPNCVVHYDASPDRTAAEWIIRIGAKGELYLPATGNVVKIGAKSQLPAEPFRLTKVDFERATKVTDEAANRFLKGLQHVEHLRVDFDTNPGHRSLAFLKDWKRVKEVWLNLNALKADLTLTTLVRECPNIERLTIVGYRQAGGIAQLKKLNNLTTLWFIYCTLDNEDFDLLVTHESLKSLFFGSCGRLKAKVEEMKHANPRLDVSTDQ